MKKIYTHFFCVMAACAGTSVSAQQQLINGDFEQWEKKQQLTIWGSDAPVTGIEPINWNSFLTACSSYAPFPTLFQFAQDQLQRSGDVRPGSTGINSARIFSTEIMGIVANGNLTTGAIHMGSMTATDALNYNFTDVRTGLIEVGTPFPYDPNEHRASFTGRPDSVEIWAKFIPVNATVSTESGAAANEAQMSFILHDAVTYKEPHATEAEKEAALIAEAFILTPATGNKWHRFSKALDYRKDINPAYLLASCTTNKTPGKGNGDDQLWVDDLHFIYNTKLRSIAIGGEMIPDFDEDTYVYHLPKNGNALAADAVTAFAYGKDAQVSKRTGENGEIIITVTDASSKGEKERVYTLLFAEAPAVTLALTLPETTAYNTIITPQLCGLPSGATAEYVVDKAALLEKQADGSFRAAGCGDVVIKAVYREEGKPAVYSNCCTVKISQLPVHILVQNVDYKRGSSLPVYKFNYAGLLPEDSLILNNVFRVMPSATSAVEKTSLPGMVFPITINPGEAYNYAVIPQGEAQVTVIKPALKVTAKNISRGEGKENPVFTYSYSGFVNNEKETTPGVMNSLPQITCEAGENAKAGEKYDIVISGATTDLYDLTHVKGVLSIKKNPGAITVPAYDVAYGDEPFTIIPAGAYEGAAYKFYPTDKNVVGVATSTGLATINKAGETEVKIKLAENAEYMAAPDVVTMVTVAKAPLTIKAQSAERMTGEENPLFELVYEGLVNGDTAEKVFPTAPETSCEATKESPAGEYPIVISPVTADNYHVTPINGILTVKVADGMDAVEVSGVRVIAVQGELRITGNSAQLPIRIYDASGRLVKQAADETVVCPAQPASVYVVFVGEKAFKVIVNG